MGIKLYQTLKTWFVEDFKPEDKLPTEHEIMERFQVGRGTVRSSLKELVREGIIERSAGKGTFLKRDFLIRLKNYKVGILLSNREFSGSDTWEYTWHNHMEMLNGVMKEALDKNISLEMIPEGAITPALNSSFDGFISFRFIDSKRLKMLEKPVVPLHYELDLAGGLAGITDHLVSQGFSRPAYIGTLQKDRAGMINRFLIERGLPPMNRESIIECSGTVQDGYNACTALMTGSNRPDVLICSTDLRALGALSFLKERGIDVPGEMGIIGFDGIHEAAHCHPGLSTWAFPWQDLGRIAVKEIRCSLDGLAPPLYKPLSGHFIQRESSSAPPVLPDRNTDQKQLSQYLKMEEKNRGLESALEELYKWSLHAGYLRRDLLETDEKRTVYDLERDIHFTFRINNSGSRNNTGTDQYLRDHNILLDNGEEYSVRLAPHSSLPRHYLLINKKAASRDSDKTFPATILTDGLELLKKLPSYTVYSSSDLNASFQGIRDHELPLMKAASSPGNRRWQETITGELLNYPLPVLRLSGNSTEKLIRKGESLTRRWREMTPGNTTDILLWQKNNLFWMALILKNTECKIPDTLRKIKNNPVGVQEAAGEWIFSLPKEQDEYLNKQGKAKSIIFEIYTGISPVDMNKTDELETLFSKLWEE